MNVVFFSFAFLIGSGHGFEASVFFFSMVGMLQYVKEREEMEETVCFFVFLFFKLSKI